MKVVIPKPIRDEAALNAALARIDELMGTKPGTPTGEKLNLLSELV